MLAAKIDHNERQSEDGGGRQLIIFKVGSQSYGVDITAVREIRAWSGVTALPNTAPFVRGVINLRGTIVPVVDLRARFGAGLTETSKTHVIIVLAIGARWVGMLVDAVSDILSVESSGVHDVPDVAEGSEYGLLSGIVTHGEEMVSLVRVEQLLSGAVIV